MDQIQTVVWQVFCARFGRSALKAGSLARSRGDDDFCHGNEHHGIDPNMLSSGHHESCLFHKGCISLHSCQTAILPHVGTLTSAYCAFSSFNQHSFQKKLQLLYGVLSKKWPLGWPWANLGRCLRNHRKALMSTKACFREKAFLGQPP